MLPQHPIQIIHGSQLTAAQRATILEVCTLAYEEDYTPYLATFPNPTHLLAWQGNQLVSHALWITRWLQIGSGPLLRTAYVEAVATHPQWQGQGLATAIMQRLAAEITAFDVGALCPADTSLYARLGWEFWQGPLFHRRGGMLIPDPEERVMLWRLPRTPNLDFSQPISIEWREGEIW